jgi:hypothetical protein
MEKNLNTNLTRFGRLFATVFAAIFALGIGLIGCNTDVDASSLFNNGDSDEKTGGGASTVAIPTASPEAGTYTSAQNVTLGTTTEGADIYYTLDGTTPTTASTKYTGPIAIGETKTLKAIAVKDGKTSGILTAVYTIEISQVATPTASMQAGTIAAGQKVTLSTVTEGAAIYYTTNGSEPTSSSTPYIDANGVIIAQDMILKAIAVKAGWDDSGILSVQYTVDMNMAAAPTALPAGGTYHVVQSVTLSTATEGGTIRYTLDGSDPADTFNSAAVNYTSGATIEINKTTTLKAVTGKQYLTTSQPMTVTYTLTPVTPTANLEAGIYNETKTVTLSSATGDATIHYTTDGTTPTATSATYSAAIPIDVSTTVKAIAVKTDWTDSEVFSGVYTLKALPPTATPAGGTYTSTQNVVLASATGGAAIYYTLDESDPTTPYTISISIGESKTLKAIA